jgi:hypothetical protein
MASAAAIAINNASDARRPADKSFTRNINPYDSYTPGVIAQQDRGQWSVASSCLTARYYLKFEIADLRYEKE